MIAAILIATAVLVTVLFITYCCISVGSHYDRDFFGE